MTNNYLQCKMNKQELVKILQEQRNHTLEFQNQMLKKNNEGLKKMLSDKDEKIYYKGEYQGLIFIFYKI